MELGDLTQLQELHLAKNCLTGKRCESHFPLSMWRAGKERAEPLLLVRFVRPARNRV